MLAEELAIWVVIGVSLLLVALLFLRGDGPPKIED